MARHLGAFPLLFLILHPFLEISFSSSENEVDQTEHYTAWPRNNDTNLSEDFPWTSCNSVTGENCPGVVDVIRHLCIPADITCERGQRKTATEGPLGKHVVLKLRPGVHSVGLTKVVNKLLYSTSFILSNYWFCNFTTFTVEGTTGNGVKTEVIASADSFTSNQWNSDIDVTCVRPSFSNTLQPSLTLFAFYGGGKLIFKDLTFRSTSSAKRSSHVVSRIRTAISTLNVRGVEIIQCRFNNIELTEGAVSLIFGSDLPSIAATIQASEFNLHFYVDVSNEKGNNWDSPPVLIESFKISPFFNSTWRIRSRRSTLSPSGGNVVLQNCRFSSKYTVLGGSDRSTGCAT